MEFLSKKELTDLLVLHTSELLPPRKRNLTMAINDPLFDDMPVDFRDMIAKPISEYETPRILLPTGHYFGECYDVVTGLSKNKGSRYFAFLCHPLEIVPQQAEAGEMEKAIKGAGLVLGDFSFPTERSLGTVIPAGQVWLGTPGGRDMAREWFATMGFSEGKPIDECIVGMRGKRVIMGIGKDKYTNAQGQEREYNVMTALMRDPR